MKICQLKGSLARKARDKEVINLVIARVIN